MLSREVLEKVRRIEIQTRRLLTDALAGEYHSIFKGRGMEFAEVREYQMGDDIRTIDWNVTSRTGTLHVKKFTEERELTVLLMLDASGSADFGTRSRFKRELAAEIGALLAFSAIRNNDRVGALVFTDDVEMYVPPRKGRSHVLRVIRDLLYFEPKGRGTNLARAAEYLNRVTRKRAVVFLLSDFLDTGFEKPLAVAAKKHDLISILISDPAEAEIPGVGLVELEDAESGRRLLVDTSDRKAMAAFHRAALERARLRHQELNGMGIDVIHVDTAVPYDRPLLRFFEMRSRRLRR
ncbi:MAG TPA: DUF58 domain-containing protein [Vicinamibacteria bacterium]|nr:DUF58 domain-containing protein [Vicinamibacteria bacterium]